jgi:hypothetical protein
MYWEATDVARGRPPLKPGWAARIVEHIPPQTEDRWISVSELMDATGLGYMQVIAAIGYLRDNFPEHSLISSKAGYRFSIDARQIRQFNRWRMSTALTVLTRSYRGAVAPYLRAVPDSPLGPLVQRQYERLLEDLGDLLTSTAS